MNEDVQKGISTTPAAEWLLDNFYIIEEQVKSLRRDLTKEVYAKLPVLDSGHLKGYARIYSIAWNCFPIPTAGLMKKCWLTT